MALIKSDYQREIVSRLNAFLQDKLDQSGFDSLGQIALLCQDTRTGNALVIKAKAAMKYHNDCCISALSNINAQSYPTNTDPQAFINGLPLPAI